MKLIKFLIIVILCTCVSPRSLKAMPTESDRQTALSLMYTMENAQEQTFEETSNYDTIDATWHNGLIPSACSYSTFAGKGYILTVAKVESGKVYTIQREYGPENPTINGTWTCVNCNGQKYNIFHSPNEHGLCKID